MAGFSPWVEINWFYVIQTVGIVGGLWITTATLRNDTKARQEETKARKVSNILAFSQRHRELWGDANRREDLKRVFLKDIDLVTHPATVAEVEFLRGISADFEDGWKIAQLTEPEQLEPLALDAGEFFSLPLPKLVWGLTRKFRNPRFVKFVERAIEDNGRLRTTGD